MVKQLYLVGKVYNIINIYNFIKFLGEEVKDLTKDFIKYIGKLYAKPNCNIEINKFKLSLIRPYRLYKSFIYIRDNKKIVKET